MSETDLTPAAMAFDSSATLGRALFFAVLIGVLALACRFTPEANQATTPGVRVELPDRLGTYWGEAREISYAEKTSLPSDTEFARKMYSDGLGNEILCSIILSGTEKRSIHRPEICLTGQGWDIKNDQRFPIRMANGLGFDVTALRLERTVGDQQGRRINVGAFYVYWFIGKDRMTPYHWKRIFLTNWDLIWHHVNHRWAYVIAHSVITQNLRPEGKSERETKEMLQRFIGDIAPTFLMDSVLSGMKESAHGE